MIAHGLVLRALGPRCCDDGLGGVRRGEIQRRCCLLRRAKPECIVRTARPNPLLLWVRAGVQDGRREPPAALLPSPDKNDGDRPPDLPLPGSPRGAQRRKAAHRLALGAQPSRLRRSACTLAQPGIEVPGGHGCSGGKLPSAAFIRRSVSASKLQSAVCLRPKETSTSQGAVSRAMENWNFSLVKLFFVIFIGGLRLQVTKRQTGVRPYASVSVKKCAAASDHGRQEVRASEYQFDDDEPLWLAVVRDLAAGLRGLVAFLAEQPRQLKYLEWPGFQNTLKTATLTLILVAVFIVALSTVDAALCYMLAWLLRKSA
ncbi:hypothetical protein EJB05_43267, partial [Eragrostis curvula]